MTLPRMSAELEKETRETMVAIRDIIRESGMTLEHIAHASSVNMSTVRAASAGQRSIGIGAASLIVKTCGYELDFMPVFVGSETAVKEV